jgi:hypothetical protein
MSYRLWYCAYQKTINRAVEDDVPAEHRACPGVRRGERNGWQKEVNHGRIIPM